MVGNLRPDICQRSWQLTQISVEWEAAGPVNIRNAINPRCLTAALSCPPAAQGSAKTLLRIVSSPDTALPYTFTNAKCLEGTVLLCFHGKSRGTPLQRHHCSPAGKGSWPQVCAGDWKPEILAKQHSAFTAPTQAAGSDRSSLCFWFLPSMQGSILFWHVIQKHELPIIC